MASQSVVTNLDVAQSIARAACGITNELCKMMVLRVSSLSDQYSPAHIGSDTESAWTSVTVDVTFHFDFKVLRRVLGNQRNSSRSMNHCSMRTCCDASVSFQSGSFEKLLRSRSTDATIECTNPHFYDCILLFQNGHYLVVSLCLERHFTFSALIWIALEQRRSLHY